MLTLNVPPLLWVVVGGRPSIRLVWSLVAVCFVVAQSSCWAERIDDERGRERFYEGLPAGCGSLYVM